MMKSQENDIKDMVIKTRLQFSDLRAKYLVELEEIEEEFRNEVICLKFQILFEFFFILLENLIIGHSKKRG